MIQSSLKKRFWILFAVLIIGGVFINVLERRGEAQVERKALRELPSGLGKWKQKGPDGRFSAQTESVLKASDYVMRDYESADGRQANVYVGYYSSQRSGATYHSPQNCLPGSGWELAQPQSVEITSPAGKSFTANQYIIQNGQSKFVLIYWYQGRGRSIASEYQDKVYTVLDSVFRQRSDGSMVRVMTAVGNDESESLHEAQNAAAQLADNLSLFVPE